MAIRLPTFEAVEQDGNWQLVCAFCSPHGGEPLADHMRGSLADVRLIAQQHLDVHHPGERARIRIAPEKEATRLHYYTGGQS